MIKKLTLIIYFYEKNFFELAENVCNTNLMSLATIFYSEFFFTNYEQ